MVLGVGEGRGNSLRRDLVFGKGGVEKLGIDVRFILQGEWAEL